MSDHQTSRFTDRQRKNVLVLPSLRSAVCSSSSVGDPAFKSLLARLACVICVAIYTVGVTELSAQVRGAPRGAVIEEIRNDRPSFMVRVDVNHANRIYETGDVLQVRVRSAKAGFLYVIYCDAGGNVNCLYPNEVSTKNAIPAMKDVVVPAKPLLGEISTKIRIGAPYGQELVKGIVSTTRLNAAALKKLLEAKDADQRVAGFQAEFDRNRKKNEWAEHHVSIETRAKRVNQPQIERPRRFGVFIGVSKYADERIRELAVCHDDAQTMAKVMQTRCAIDQAWVLTNEQATRSNIESMIRRQLVAATRPGDSVVIYWSGHGSRCADESGDEADGLDEFLVPYDGQLAELEKLRETMILDDTFGRWLQELDGRRILLIIDTCYGGGQGTSRSLSGPSETAARTFEFLDTELARARSVGQRETGLLASSSSSQISFERREGDLSTMTYFLVSHLNAQGGAVSLKDCYGVLKEQVSKYVAEHFPGAIQTPLLVDNFQGQFLLRP